MSTILVRTRGAEIYRVIYQKDRVEVPPDFFLNLRPHGDKVVPIMTVKSADWSYEKEYRALALLADCESVDFGEKTFYAKQVKETQIAGAIVGARATDEQMEIAESLRQDLPSISIRKASLSDSTFSLAFGPLS